MQYQVLDVNFISKRDKGTVTTSGSDLPNDTTAGHTQYVGFTALNTPNANVPSPAVCQEVARS
jgi:hypothetical protein